MIVDAHAHVYRTAAQGRHHKGDYEIDEYGPAEIDLIPDDGTIDDFVAHLAASPVDRAFVLALFGVRPAAGADGVVLVCPGDDGGAPLPMSVDAARTALVDVNAWCTSLGSAPGVVPFITLEPTLLQGEALRGHVQDCIAAGAQGVKLHSILQGFHASDPRLDPAYEVLQEAGLPVIAHSGSTSGARADYAVPAAFGGLAARFPGLPLVLAHLGGGAWRTTAEFAAAHPGVRFDCCEIIHWMHAPDGPSGREVAELILDIGVERVLHGSDYPWYGLDESVDRVLGLPLLSEDDKQMVLGQNALDLLPA